MNLDTDAHKGKEYSIRSVRMPKPVLNKLKRMSKKEGVSFSTVVRQACFDFIKQQGK